MSIPVNGQMRNFVAFCHRIEIAASAVFKPIRFNNRKAAMAFQRNSTRKLIRGWRGLAIASLLVIAPTYPAIAQIIPDTTLPVNSSVPLDCTVCTIDGGTVRGANLYHSFSQFSVPTNGTAYFNNSAAIQAIFARVTGGDRSNIDGLIRTNGTASLFLLNPNGILLGANARLDIAGTFVATTASSLKFADGSEFSATNPQAPPLLTVNITPGLQYGNSQPGATITNRGNLSAGQNFTLVANQLDLQGQLQAGNNLTLITDGAILGNASFISGGDVDFQSQGDINIRQIKTLGGSITLNSQNGSIITSTNNRSGIADLDATSSQSGGGKITLTANGNIIVGRVYSDSTASAAGNSGGAITLFSSHGNIQADHVFSYSTSPLGNGGDITLIASNGSIKAWGFSSASDSSNNGSSPAGNGGSVNLVAKGNIDIIPPSLSFLSGIFTFASSSNGVAGNGGKIGVTTTSGNITIAGDISSGSPFANGGDVSIATSQGNVDLGIYGIYTRSLGLGKGGDIAVSVQGGSLKIGETNAFSLEGVGGAIALNATRDLITYSLNSTGKLGSGNIIITSGGTFSTGVRRRGESSNSSVISSDTFGAGRGGEIWIIARWILLQEGAQVSASTHGSGDGGNIFLRGLDGIVLSGVVPNGVKAGPYARAGLTGVRTGQYLGGYIPTGITSNINDANLTSGQFPSGVFTQTTVGSTGNAGNIALEAGQLTVADGAAIAATTFGQGNAGNIQVRVPNNSIALNRGSIFSGVAPNALGNSGTIYLQTRLLSLANGLIQTRTLSSGNAGGIQITTTDAVTLTGSDSAIRSGSGDPVFRSNQIGTAGDIRLATGNLILGDRASLTAETFTAARGGSIVINANNALIQNGSRITVSGQGIGAAGDIQIQASNLTLERQAQVLSSTASSQGGNIRIQVQQPFWMRNNSLISATSGTAGADGDGGNIWIQAPFLLALPQENNDIIANAYSARGGRIEITAQGIFGFELRSRNDLIRLLRTINPAKLDPQRLSSNDITAISQANPILNGDVILNTQPQPRTLPLPSDLLDGARLLSQRCSSQSTQDNSFIMTGRGGLPPSPLSILSGDTVLTQLVSLDGEPGEKVAGNPLQKANFRAAPNSALEPSQTDNPAPNGAIIEAQGWVLGSDGKVSLVTSAPTARSEARWPASATCQ